MCAAFVEAGIDVTAADRFVGTSAGAVVTSQLANGRKPLDEMQLIVEERPDSSYSNAIGDNMTRLITVMGETADMAPAERIKALGSLALEAETAPEESFLDRFSNVGGDGWPPRFMCTAIDVEDGTFVAWSEESGVDPVRAVASSCSVPGFFPPITINGRRYMDGGMRSMTNADLAAGCDRVLILTLFIPPPDATDPRALRVRNQLDSEVAAIEKEGGKAELLAPDADAQEVIGVNLMDPSRAKDAADAGYAQGTRAADRVAAFWNPA
jgi:NTE family protein